MVVKTCTFTVQNTPLFFNANFSSIRNIEVKYFFLYNFKNYLKPFGIARMKFIKILPLEIQKLFSSDKHENSLPNLI